MLNTQYLASSLRADHPAHSSVSRPDGPRKMKHTLQSRFKDDISRHLVDGCLPAGAFPESKVDIHTEYVRKSLLAQGNNPLLHIPTPDVDQSESILPRHYRSTLSQLRSGHCNNLAAYLHRVGRSASPSCPLCSSGDQTVHHLFSCPASPSDLSIIDLWQKPTRVAAYLSSHPSFSLPPLTLPRPRPPPAPTWQ